jgi:hypothetical protein
VEVLLERRDVSCVQTMATKKSVRLGRIRIARGENGSQYLQFAWGWHLLDTRYV